MDIKKLNTDNFADFERLVSRECQEGCYCSFWHQKWDSAADWEKRKTKTPDYNRNLVLKRIRSCFHVGVLVYEAGRLLAWIAAGPGADFYWTFPRVVQLGDEAKTTACILCVIVENKSRRPGLHAELLQALKAYGKIAGWTPLEGYPFDLSAIRKHGVDFLRPGLTPAFEKAGFKCTGPHWLSDPQAERSIFRVAL